MFMLAPQVTKWERMCPWSKQKAMCRDVIPTWNLNNYFQENIFEHQKYLLRNSTHHWGPPNVIVTEKSADTHWTDRNRCLIAVLGWLGGHYYYRGFEVVCTIIIPHFSTAWSEGHRFCCFYCSPFHINQQVNSLFLCPLPLQMLQYL